MHIDCEDTYMVSCWSSLCPSICPTSVRISIFLFPDDNLSRFQWIFYKLVVCIDIVEIWFGIATGQISSIFDSYLPITYPYFCFQIMTWVNISGFSLNLVCTLIWRSVLGLLMGKFHQFFTELSAHDRYIFSFQDNNLSKSQQILTKLDICIDIIEIWFWILLGTFHLILVVISPWHYNCGALSFQVFIYCLFF